MKKELYDISVLLKIFKRFEKVVLAWKNWEKWGKMGENGLKWLSENPHIYTTQALEGEITDDPLIVSLPEKLSR